MATELNAGSVVVDITGDPSQIVSAFNSVQSTFSTTTQSINAANAALTALQTQVQVIGPTTARSGAQSAAGLNHVAQSAAQAAQTAAVLNAQVQQVGPTVAQSAAQANAALSGLKSNLGQTGGMAATLGGKGNLASVAITQLGFAAEDAITVYGTMGLAGALRSAGNNLSFLASNITPFTGLLVGVGTATAALVYQFSQMEEQADASTDALKDMENQVADTARAIRDATRDAAANPPEVEGVFDEPQDRFERNQKQFEDSIRDQNNELDKLADERESVLSRLSQGISGIDFDAIDPTQLVGGFSLMGREEIGEVLRQVDESQAEFEARAERIAAQLGGITRMNAEGANTISIQADSDAMEARMRRAVDDLNAAFDSIRAGDPVEDQLTNIQAAFAEIRDTADDAADAAGGKPEDFLPEGFAEVEKQLLGVVDGSKEAQKGIKDIEESMEELKQNATIAGLLKPALDILEDEKSTYDQLVAAQQRFNDLLKQGLISQEKWNELTGQINTTINTRNQDKANDLLEMTVTEEEKLLQMQEELNRLRDAGTVTAEEFLRIQKHISAELLKQNEDYQRAQEIIEQTRSPLEVYKDGVEEIQRLLDKGLIDQETFNRAEDQLQEDLDNATETEPKGPRALSGALTIGSSEALSALNQAMVERDTLDKAAEEQKKANKELAKIEKNTRKKQKVFTV